MYVVSFAPPQLLVIIGALSLTSVTLTAIPWLPINTLFPYTTLFRSILLAPTSVGASKLGAAIKLNTPLALLILNLLASAPPLILKLKLLLSTARKSVVYEAVVFSGMDILALAQPPLLVIIGALSFTSVTQTATAYLSHKLPYYRCIITSYILLAPTSVGASKLGAAIKLNTPLALLILNLLASAPPLILKLKLLLSTSVDVTVVNSIE